MAEDIRMGGRAHDGRRGSLGELIHAAVRRAIEDAVDVELTGALGAPGTRAAGAVVAIAMGPNHGRGRGRPAR